MTREALKNNLKSRIWRLNNLYKIRDKSGRIVTFKFNSEQSDYYKGEHTRNIILKARQLGFTTLKAIMQLDAAFFERSACGLISHDLDSAGRLFREKTKFAYERMPEALKKINGARNDKAGELVFDRGGYVYVGTSARGGTLNDLHVSEFGKICAKYPHKAEEIVTGAFESVPIDGVITLESTAEGRSGYFYDYCQESQRKGNESLSALDWKFFFYDWFSNPDYSLSGSEKQLSIETEAYFDKLAFELSKDFDIGQKLWYQSKANTLGDKVKREYPSTPKEAFEQAIEGAYYQKQFMQARKDGRIGEVPNNPHSLVSTYWDIGVGDSTTIWFAKKVGNEYHIIDYYENSGEGLRHYMKVLKDKGYDYEDHYAPHDIDNREFGNDAKSRKESAAEGYEIDGQMYSVYFKIVPRQSIENGIEQVREILDYCVFDEKKCAKGIAHLEAYRKDWDAKNGIWKDKPLHNEASHAADAFRYFAVANTKAERQAQHIELPFF